MVGLYYLPDQNRGLGLWRLLCDTLQSDFVCQNIELLLANFDSKDPLSSWENIKVKVQGLIQYRTKFRYQQAKRELASLRTSLRWINKSIYNGENLEKDRL